MIPEIEFGSTILRMVCHFVPPRETLTTRNDWGTALKASSDVLMITGSVMIARVREAARMLVPSLKNNTKMPRPNRPYTIEGIPARLIIAIRIALVQRLSLAYSDRYIAAATPSGHTNIVVSNVRYTVPRIAGKIPPERIPSEGKSIRNSIEIAGTPWTKM
jgi:hypothetical protein